MKRGSGWRLVLGALDVGALGDVHHHPGAGLDAGHGRPHVDDVSGGDSPPAATPDCGERNA